MTYIQPHYYTFGESTLSLFHYTYFCTHTKEHYFRKKGQSRKYLDFRRFIRTNAKKPAQFPMDIEILSSDLPSTMCVDYVSDVIYLTLLTDNGRPLRAMPTLSVPYADFVGTKTFTEWEHGPDMDRLIRRFEGREVLQTPLGQSFDSLVKQLAPYNVHLQRDVGVTLSEAYAVGEEVLALYPHLQESYPKVTQPPNIIFEVSKTFDDDEITEGMAFACINDDDATVLSTVILIRPNLPTYKYPTLLIHEHAHLMYEFLNIHIPEKERFEDMKTLLHDKTLQDSFLDFLPEEISLDEFLEVFANTYEYYNKYIEIAEIEMDENDEGIQTEGIQTSESMPLATLHVTVGDDEGAEVLDASYLAYYMSLDEMFARSEEQRLFTTLYRKGVFGYQMPLDIFLDHFPLASMSALEHFHARYLRHTKTIENKTIENTCHQA